MIQENLSNQISNDNIIISFWIFFYFVVLVTFMSWPTPDHSKLQWITLDVWNGSPADSTKPTAQWMYSTIPSTHRPVRSYSASGPMILRR